MCVSLSYPSELKLKTLLSVCGITFGKIKFLCWFFCCLILCQHVHLKVCIITIFHFILLLQFIKCTVWLHHNISKIPSKVWPSACIYTRFTSNSPMTNSKKKEGERKRGGAWVKVIMRSRFFWHVKWNLFVLTNIFELCSFFVAWSTFMEKTVCEGVATWQQLRTRVSYGKKGHAFEF